MDPSISSHTVTKIRFDQTYVQTLPGILKVAQMVTGIIAFICVVSGGCSFCSQKNWFGFVSISGFWVTFTLLAFYLLRIIEKFRKISWLVLEFIFCVVWVFFYFIASLVVSLHGGYEPSWAAGAFFGFLAMALYGVDAFLKFTAWRKGETAQGGEQ